MVGLWHWHVIYIYMYVCICICCIYKYIYIYHISNYTNPKLETLGPRKLPGSHQASPNAAPLSAPLSGSSLKATAQLPQCLTQELLSSIDNSWWKMGAFLLEIQPGESDLQIFQIEFVDMFLFIHIINGLRGKSRVLSFFLGNETGWRKCYRKPWFPVNVPSSTSGV